MAIVTILIVIVLMLIMYYVGYLDGQDKIFFKRFIKWGENAWKKIQAWVK